MGQGRHRGEAVEPDSRHGGVRPFGQQGDVGEALGRGEGGAGIDDGDVEAGDPRHRGQRLADVHGADHHQAHGRHLDGQEQGSAFVLDRAALALAQGRGERLGEGIGFEGGGRHQPLLVRGEVGHHDGGAARGALGIEPRQDLEAHQSTRST